MDEFSQVEASKNSWIDGLTDGYQWNKLNDRTTLVLNYFLHGDATSNEEFIRPDKNFRSYEMLAEERNTFQESLKQIENICDIQFIQINHADTADLNLFITGGSLSLGRSGFAYAPNPEGKSRSGTVGLNLEFHRAPGAQELDASIQLGSFYGLSFLHEISHALGLKHPHDRGLSGQPRFPGINNKFRNYLQQGDFNANSHPNTQMGYALHQAGLETLPRKRDFGYLKTLGSLDTTTLQWIYGINKEHNNGNNKYRLPPKNSNKTGWTSIWDTGGEDTIVGKNSKNPVIIDLRNATLELNESAGGYKSAVEGVAGGFVISHDWDGKKLMSKPGICIIENAIGGTSNDTLKGNQYNNQLSGRGGNDNISGGEGDDTLIGGTGRDTLTGDKGADTFLLTTTDIDRILDFSFAEGDEIQLKKKGILFTLDENNLQLIDNSSHEAINPRLENFFSFNQQTNQLFFTESDQSRSILIAEVDLL